MTLRAIIPSLKLLTAPVVLSLMLLPSLAQAATTTTTTATSTTGTGSSVQSQKLANIINKGNEEIERRLTNLSSLSALISSTAKLTSDDKASLTSEVNYAIIGLNNLKTQLDSETSLSAAEADVNNIVTEYRVYVLINPKVHLIKVADDQQVIEAKLTALSQKLSTKVTGNTDLESQLSAMNNSINSAQTISSAVETNVISLQPADYNGNHAVLAGYNSQLQAARSDIEAAVASAKSIVSSLSSVSASSTSSAKTTK